MKYVLLSFFVFFFHVLCYSQNLQKRIILIGDAGEISIKQSTLLEKAAELIKKDSTIVFFLGDNIYPSGMGLEGESKEEGIKSLQSQFVPFRQANVPVYFLAGNHDWNVSKVGGLEKLKAQEEFLIAQQDSNLQLIPKAGEPGPVVLNLAEGLTTIAYDSEYWLYPHHSDTVNLEEKRKKFNHKLTELFALNADNVVLVLSHHPMATYGEHSLVFGWKQHLFPLTRLNKNLYIPLPIVGSLYPLWRGVLFKSAEDLPSKPYQQMIHGVIEARGDHPNVVFAAGHDHGLQFIQKDTLNQVVSGSGSKSSFIRNNKSLKFKYQQQGFSVLDYLENGDFKLSYYTYDGTNVNKAFETIIVKGK